MRSWRLALRLAWREAVRARGRSLLTLVMILLPVLGVTAADVVFRTSQVSGPESLDRRIGAADARLDFLGGGTVEQGVDPEHELDTVGKPVPEPPTLATVRSVLGAGTTGITVADGDARVLTRQGVAVAAATETDLRDPVARGLFTLDRGRLPRDDHEVVVTAALAARGPGLGETLRLAGGARRTVVGLVDSTATRGVPAVAGPPGSLHLRGPGDPVGWLVDAKSPVSWSQVRRLNDLGASVVSRSVITDPPPRAELPQQFRSVPGRDPATLTVLVLVVVMVLLEVVLLAGPAFAVGARRQQRTLALMGATGATPRHVRRVVLANGVVLGGLGTGLGVLLGLAVGGALVPLVQRFSTTRFGAYDVSVRDVAGVAVLGLLSAVLAALVPAWSASRQDVVAVLAGRRGDRPAGARSPVLGVLLLASGVLVAVDSARSDRGENTIAVSALVCVVGMILLIPVVMRALSAVVGGFPLAVRYAVRDAARHRTRTVPAVAAVAATVAGVVALGIGVTSDDTSNRVRYSAQVPMGDALLTDYSASKVDWSGLASTVRRTLPGARVVPVTAPAPNLPGQPDRILDVTVTRPGAAAGASDDYTSFTGPAVLVDDGSGGVTRLPLGLSADQSEQARRALTAGRVVVLSPRPVDAERARVSRGLIDANGEPQADPRATTVPATYLRVPLDVGRAQALVPPRVARAAGVPTEIEGLVVSGARISTATEQDLDERLGVDSDAVNLYVERGYQGDQTTLVVQLVLAGLGLVLMLGGTLTATFLALSDARGDLGTLSAVGAAPRTRRRVAAAYAGVIGGVGALLGAAVGFVPGIAVSFPLTRDFGPGGEVPGHVLDVPWLLVLGVVVLLPVVTALVVWVSARGRLPMVARLE